MKRSAGITALAVFWLGAAYLAIRRVRDRFLG